MIARGYLWRNGYPDMTEEEYEERERARDEAGERRFKQYEEEHD